MSSPPPQPSPHHSALHAHTRARMHARTHGRATLALRTDDDGQSFGPKSEARIQKRGRAEVRVTFRQQRARHITYIHVTPHPPKYPLLLLTDRKHLIFAFHLNKSSCRRGVSLHLREPTLNL